jgi:hypothetical protein
MRGRLIMRWHFALMLLLGAGQAQADGIRALGANEILRGRFIQERELQGFDAPLRSEGNFMLAPGRGLIWHTEKPFVITTLMTAKGLAQQTDGTITLNLPASRAPFMAGLYDMLTGALAGDWRAMERDFSIEKSESEGKWRLRLTPRDSTPDAAMPIVTIDVAGSEFVESVEIEKQGGDRDRLVFADQDRSPGPLGAEELSLLEAVGGP